MWVKGDDCHELTRLVGSVIAAVFFLVRVHVGTSRPERAAEETTTMVLWKRCPPPLPHVEMLPDSGTQSNHIWRKILQCPPEAGKVHPGQQKHQRTQHPQ